MVKRAKASEYGKGEEGREDGSRTDRSPLEIEGK